MELCNTKLSWEPNVSEKHSKPRLNVCVLAEALICAFVLLLAVCNVWRYGLLKLISTWPHASSLPPGTLLCRIPLLLLCSPNRKLLPTSLPVSGFLGTICILMHGVRCWGCASAAWQVLPALEYNQRFLWVVRVFFACSFYLVDQGGLLNSPLLKEIDRIFAMCNMRYKTRSQKEPEQQLDMNINWYLLMNFAD